MGYLSGASPHIKSGAVSVLSGLVYNNAEICLLIPDLVPSVLALLQTKAVEVIKVSVRYLVIHVLSPLLLLSSNADEFVVELNRLFWVS